MAAYNCLKLLTMGCCYIEVKQKQPGAVIKGVAKIKSVAYHLRWLVRTRADVSLWPSGLPRTDIKLRPSGLARIRTDIKLQPILD